MTIRSRPRPRRMARTPRQVATRTMLTIGDASVAVGTTRLTNLTTSLVTATGDTIAGGRVLSVRGWGNLIGSVGGSQSYTAALLIGPNSLDAADVFPRSAYDDFAWWMWLHKPHRGQQHNVLAAAAEFTEHAMSFRTRGSRRIPRLGSALFLAEETLGQAQNARWDLEVRFTR